MGWIRRSPAHHPEVTKATWPCLGTAALTWDPWRTRHSRVATADFSPLALLSSLPCGDKKAGRNPWKPRMGQEGSAPLRDGQCHRQEGFTCPTATITHLWVRHSRPARRLPGFRGHLGVPWGRGVPAHRGVLGARGGQGVPWPRPRPGRLSWCSRPPLPAALWGTEGPGWDPWHGINGIHGMG